MREPTNQRQPKGRATRKRLRRILLAFAAVAALAAVVVPAASAARIYSGHCYGDVGTPTYLAKGNGWYYVAGGISVTCSGNYWNQEHVVIQKWTGSSWQDLNSGCTWTQYGSVYATCSGTVYGGTTTRVFANLSAS